MVHVGFAVVLLAAELHVGFNPIFNFVLAGGVDVFEQFGREGLDWGHVGRLRSVDERLLVVVGLDVAQLVLLLEFLLLVHGVLLLDQRVQGVLLHAMLLLTSLLVVVLQAHLLLLLHGYTSVQRSAVLLQHFVFNFVPGGVFHRAIIVHYFVQMSVVVLLGIVYFDRALLTDQFTFCI